MHLTVGYLGAPTGDDGVAPASVPAKTFGTDGPPRSAVKKLDRDGSDALVAGPCRFAAARRIFLGSTAARILAGTAAPVIVDPRDDA